MTNKEKQILDNTIKRCKEKGIIIPTYKQMMNPELIPEKIKQKLKELELWDLHPLNLFRITWKNEPVKAGGGFGGVNYVELPSEITGVKARIFVLLGKFFPTGAHKVGATFGPLVEKLVTGKFDPTTQKALWPSTGNYCRGGAYDSYLLGCHSIAVLPMEMSQERFDWLEKVGSEVIRTPGCESNVKEIYDETKRLKNERGDEIVVLNQFAEFGNSLWHYHVTGKAMQEVFNENKTADSTFSGICLTQGSAGTLGCADYLRKEYPQTKVVCSEALQCPTLLYNGYGGHRIEGIGDKHVPWIHNLKNMDVVVDIDDDRVMKLMRLFNEEAGRELLKSKGVPESILEKLDLFGISSIANVLTCIKTAKYYEMDENDCLFTVATDSMEMYGSRMREAQAADGEYSPEKAAIDYYSQLLTVSTDNMLELSYYDKKRMHNLKYFTWIEQQDYDLDELNAQWYDKKYWDDKYSVVDEWDTEIEEFNEKTGLLKEYE